MNLPLANSLFLPRVRAFFRVCGGVGCVFFGAVGLLAEERGPLQIPEISEISGAEVFQYSVPARDPFVDASVVRTLLSQAGEKAEVGKQPELESYGEELNQLLSELYSIQGVISGPSGGSALVGRRIVRVGESIDIFLGESLLKRLEQTNRVYTLGLEEMIHMAVIPAKVVRIEPTGVWLEMPGMKTLLEMAFRKTKVDPASRMENYPPQKRK